MTAEIFRSLKDTVLTDAQKVWLEQAYPLGDQIDETDVARALGKKIPTTFEPYRDLGKFWAGNRLTVFGRYKVNEKDELVLTLHAIMVQIRDDFVERKSKKFVSARELAQATNKDQSIILRIMNFGYFHDFWPTEGGAGRVEYNSEINEWVFRFHGVTEYLRIREYKGLEEQLEMRWKKINGFSEKEAQKPNFPPIEESFKGTKDKNTDVKPEINSDEPKDELEDDAFGYIAVAQRVAEVVSDTRDAKGLVVAIHGGWGSGKTSLINFTKKIIEKQYGDKVVLIDFNPWWFSNGENLTSQFLAQFISKLPKKNDGLKVVGDLLAQYGNSIGAAVAFSTGIPWIDVVIGTFLKIFKRKVRNIESLKNEISDALKMSEERFLFIVDDIDRLVPEEIVDLFKVIKALADFKNVVYLLSFDREIVSNALSTSLKLNGDSYLEKIIQVPINLPAISQRELNTAFFSKIDQVIGEVGFINFEEIYWANIFYAGLAQFIKKPRDIVRIANALNVTYPIVYGEVNTVDFIAIECLRLFLPEAYDVIRDNEARFAGISEKSERADEKKFHESWLEKVDEDWREGVRNLVMRLFPRMDSIFGNVFYDLSTEKNWRSKLRIASPKVFDIYFRFGISDLKISRKEIKKFIFEAANPRLAAENFLLASKSKRIDGSSKVGDYLDHIRDLSDELEYNAAKGLAIALFDVGDVLLFKEDEGVGFAALPNSWRLWGTVKNIFERIPVEERVSLLRHCISYGKAVGLAVVILDYIVEPGENPGKNPWNGIEDQVALLKPILLEKFNEKSDEEVLEIFSFPYTLIVLQKWFDKNNIIDRIKKIISLDTLLPRFLENFVTETRIHSSGDVVSKRRLRLDPKSLEVYGDLVDMENRLGNIDLSKYSDSQRIAIETFFNSMKKVKAGKSIDEGVE
jgi:predicted KAP-like P-loop ATPase